MTSSNKTWRGDLDDGASIEVLWARYSTAPAMYRDDPLFWQAQSSWEDDPPTPASIPPDQVTSRCKRCLQGYVFSRDDLAWLTTAFSLAPCGHPWSDIVPMLQWLPIQTQEGLLPNLQNREGAFTLTITILGLFQLLSQRWEYVQQGLRKKIGEQSSSMTELMEDIGRKNTYDSVFWLVSPQRVPEPTIATVNEIRQTLETKLNEAKINHNNWAGETIGKCQARGAAETYMLTLAQFAWFFPQHLITQEAEGNLRVPIVREEKEPGDKECEEAIILLEEPDPDLKVGYILLSTRREQTTFCEQDFDEGEDANRSYREVLAPEALSYGLLCCTCNRLLVALRTKTSSERS